VNILIIEHLTWTTTSLPITVNDDTDEDQDAKNQLTSDVNS